MSSTSPAEALTSPNGGPSPSVPSPSTAAADATVASLQARNAQLRQENDELRQRLAVERALRHAAGVASDSHKTLEAAVCKEQIRATDDKAEILALHDELLRLRQTCAVYAEATEESRTYFFELKRLYAELEKHLRPEMRT